MINIKFFNSLQKTIENRPDLLRETGRSDTNLTDSLKLWNSAVKILSPREGGPVAINLPLSLDWFSAGLTLLMNGVQPLFLPEQLNERNIENWLKISQSECGILQKTPAKRVQELLKAAIQTEGIETLPNWTLLNDLKKKPLPQLKINFDEELFRHSTTALTLSEGELTPPELLYISPEQFINTIESFRLWWEREELKPSSLLLNLPPTLGTWNLIFSSLLHGIPTVLIPKLPTWEELQKLSSLYPDSLFISTNQLIWKLKNSITKETVIPELKAIISVGGPLPDKMLPNLPIGRVLWSEEWGGLLSWNTGDNGESWGVLAPNVQFQVRRQQKIYRRDHPSFGKIYLRGPRYNPRSATSRGDLKMNLPNEEGWVETPFWGDVKKDRKLWLEGLFDELIQYKEDYYSLWKVELYLMFHPDISAATVRPIPDSSNSISKAYVELMPPTSRKKQLTIRAVNRYLQEHLPHYLCPRYVEFCEQLPRTWFGNIARWQLK